MAVPVLGLDVGGSKTYGVLSDGEEVLAEVFVDSANPSSVGEAEAARQLDALFAQLGPVRPEAVCAGAAGVDSAEGADRFRRLLLERASSARVSVVHDAELILAAVGSTSGIAVISGTGSVAWGRSPDGRVARAGGWGYLLGDESSGYGWPATAYGTPWGFSTEGRNPTCSPSGSPRPAASPGASCCWTGSTLGRSGATGLSTPGSSSPSRPRATRPAAGSWQPPRRPWPRWLAPAATGSAAPPVVLGGGLAVHQPILQAGIRSILAADGYTDVRDLDRDPVHGAVALAQALLEFPS